MQFTQRIPARISRYQNRQVVAPSRRALDGLDWATLCVGLTASFSVTLIGTIQVSEILMFILLPYLLVTQRHKWMSPGMKMVYVMMGFWLLGQILTDIYRDTVARNWMRGDARIIFFALNLATLTMLLSKSVRRQALFIGGYGAGSLLAARLQPSSAIGDYPWKFGYAEGTMVLVILLSCYFHYKRRYWAAALLLGALVATNLVLNFRSPILFLLVTIALAIPIVPERIGRLRILPEAGTRKRVFALVCIAFVFMGSSEWLVKFASRAGLVSADAQEKNMAESESSVGLLLGGRPEIFVSSRAVMESPILGYGSWAQDLKYNEMLYDIDVKYNIPTDSLESIEDAGGQTIPAHSHIMSTWVQSGILGAVFWAYILWLAIRGLLRTALVQPPLSPYYIWLLAGFVWAVLFSPFGNTRRAIDSLVILIALEVMELYPKGDDTHRFRSRGAWKRTPSRRGLVQAAEN